MRFVIQRVKSAKVSIHGEIAGSLLDSNEIERS